MALELSPKFLHFLEEYAQKTGKAASTIVEEATSQAILRHESDAPHSAHDALLMPTGIQREVLGLIPGFAEKPADTPFGDLMEHLPDRNWLYQVGRLEEWWFLVISLTPVEFPEPLELRSVENSQAYAWLFGYTKSVKMWSATDRFLVVF